ncbi:MAG: phosphate ABC transporter permease PstA [Haloarculaceae archaeon]
MAAPDRVVDDGAGPAGGTTPEQAPDWTADAGGVTRIRGRAFEAVCLAAVSVALVAVLVLLLYVAVDAVRPFSADFEWHLTYLVTLILPVVAAAVYYYLLDEPAGEVAYVTAGLPVVGLLLTGGFVVLIVELVTVAEVFATIVATTAALLAITAHNRLRPRAALERLGVIIVAPTLAIFGLPPEEVVAVFNWATTQLGIPFELTVRTLSLREVVLFAPVLPLEWIMLSLAIALPVAGGLGVLLSRRRESRRAGVAFAGLSLVGAALGVVAGPAIGIGAVAWVLLFSWTVPPLAFYVEGVLRRGEGVQGLAFPAIVVVGAAVGTLVVQQFGFAGPDPWLDWGFLTSAHSRIAADAGFYPAIVGSVMMLLVIVLATFPVGVGAAIYLEEYAPATGLGGRFVTLVEINIGNLAGVPSVVYGLLGLALFIRFIHMPAGSVIVGGLAVGLLILPIVIIASQEAIRAVPDSHREAAFGMGATQWQTVRDIVLPQAIPGILTGTILAVGRAIGETAPLLMIGAASSVRLAPDGFYDQLPAMPRQIYAWSTNLSPEIRHGVLAAGVVTLLAVLLIMNGTAIIIRNKYQREA